jgi:teichuronic acid biosynthesis glycosyltransferase TuaC
VKRVNRAFRGQRKTNRLPRGDHVKGRSFVTLEHEDPRADVLVVTSGWPHSDDETYGVFIKRQMKSLIERGLRCDVLFIRGYRSPLAYPLAALRLASWSLTRRHRYALVHAHGGEAALAAAFYRCAPLLVSYLGSDLLGAPRSEGISPLGGRIRRALVRQHARLATRTITKSRELETTLPTSVRARNIVLPNGVDMDLFRPIDRVEARRELGFDVDWQIALFAANPSVPVKRYWLAEAAVDRARRLLPDLRLQVARGVKPELVPLLMNAADCLLLTSSTEGSPNVVKEALMCNLPVVTTPAGDVAELLEGVVPSYLCEPSETALAEALLDCLRERRRSNGREVSGRLDARIVADSLLALYKELAPELNLESEDGGVNAAKTDAL